MTQSTQASKAPQLATALNKQNKLHDETAIIDYVAVSKKEDDETQRNISGNPLYQIIIENEGPKEQRIAKVVAYLTEGLEDDSIKIDQIDKRERELIEFNEFIQVLRKQLGTEQAKEITSKAYADFQRIVNDTSADVATFQEELNPLCRLADLFDRFGADGNIIEKINTAKEAKLKRESALAAWQFQHDADVLELENEIRNLEEQITSGNAALQDTTSGLFHFLKGRLRLELEAKIKNLENDLTARQEQLEIKRNEKPIKSAEDDVDITTVGQDEDILELQNIGGAAFKEAIMSLRDHTEQTMAKMSSNFNEAVAGLTNTRESFVNMDRNCSDANFALSILSVAVKEAEIKARTHAQSLVTGEKSGSETGIEELDRMEKEQRSELILGYTDHLTTFLTDLGVAIASLRSGQAVIKNILRMNQLALQSANTHKITGIANTADAVAITIGSIIEVCNRAASRALADGLTRMRTLAEEGNQRLTGGTYESLQQQNEQLAGFVDSVESIKRMTQEISANSVELLKQQFALVEKMNQESIDLASATTESERTMFQARAGQNSESTKKKEESPKRSFGLRVGG